MAKSIRSQRGKKMRAIKRVRYNQKQLKQLKETVARNVTHHVIEGGMDLDSARAEVADYLELKKKQLADKLQQQQDAGAMEQGDVTVYSRKTMKNDKGQYPEWMGKKQIRKQKHRNDKRRKGNGRMKGW